MLATSWVVAEDVPLKNWSVDRSWRLPVGSGFRTLSTEALIGSPVVFQGMDLCRIVDTRNPAGTFGGPSLTQGTPRDFPLPTGQCSGIPTTVIGFSLNLTVTNTTGAGFIIIWPQGGTQPSVSTLNYVAGQTLANAAIVAAGTIGGGTIVAGISNTDLIIDINAFFVSTLPSTNPFSITSTGSQAAIVGTNSGDRRTALASPARLPETGQLCRGSRRGSSCA